MASPQDCTGLSDLPAECVVEIAKLLQLPADVACVAQTCSSLAAYSHLSELWSHLLLRDYGVQAEGLTETLQARDLYIQLHTSGTTDDLRFKGCYTDGGCDGGQMRYWVDNLFMPNHWETYCSDSGSNVNCVGLLVGDKSEADRQATEHRLYLIQRCQTAADRLFQRTMNLECWTTAELEHFFQELYAELQQGAPMGSLLMIGISRANLGTEMQRMAQAMELLEKRQETHKFIMLEDQEEASSSDQLYSMARGSKGLRMFDKRTAALVTSPEFSWVASVENCIISRAGAFSCPVASGAVFIGNFRSDANGCTQEELGSQLEVITEAGCSAALEDATTLDMVEAAVAEGKLPQIIAAGGYAGAEWVEFDPGSGFEQHGANLRPVLWFRFFDSSGANRRRQQGMPASQVPSEGDGAEPSGAAAGGDGDGAPQEAADADVEGPGGFFAGLLGEVMGLGDMEGIMRSTNGRNKLTVPLTRRHGGNLALVKLIGHEDLRNEWQDAHDHPNIDVNFITLQGRLANMSVSPEPA